MMCEPLDMLPVECVVRGYLAAQTVENGTSLTYVWDVFDRSRRRIQRSEDAILLAGAAANPWSVVDDDLESSDGHHGTIDQFTNIVRLGPLQATAKEVPRFRRQARHGICQQGPISGMNPRGDIARSADGGYREGVIQVAVCQQHRHGIEPVFGKDFVQLGTDIGTRVYDDALATRFERQHIAVRAEGGCRKADDEHGNPPDLGRVWNE